jgi:hypothetical protein
MRFYGRRLGCKSTGIKSAIKLYIIQNVDRKLSLDDIAKAKGLTMEALLKEMEQIVYSGTKLNIKYWMMKCLMTNNKRRFMITLWNQSPIR